MKKFFLLFLILILAAFTVAQDPAAPPADPAAPPADPAAPPADPAAPAPPADPAAPAPPAGPAPPADPAAPAPPADPAAPAPPAGPAPPTDPAAPAPPAGPAPPTDPAAPAPPGGPAPPGAPAPPGGPAPPTDPAAPAPPSPCIPVIPICPPNPVVPAPGGGDSGQNCCQCGSSGGSNIPSIPPGGGSTPDMNPQIPAEGGNQIVQSYVCFDGKNVYYSYNSTGTFVLNSVVLRDDRKRNFTIRVISGDHSLSVRIPANEINPSSESTQTVSWIINSYVSRITLKYTKTCSDVLPQQSRKVILDFPLGSDRGVVERSILENLNHEEGDFSFAWGSLSRSGDSVIVSAGEIGISMDDIFEMLNDPERFGATGSRMSSDFLEVVRREEMPAIIHEQLSRAGLSRGEITGIVMGSIGGVAIILAAIAIIYYAVTPSSSTTSSFNVHNARAVRPKYEQTKISGATGNKGKMGESNIESEESENFEKRSAREKSGEESEFEDYSEQDSQDFSEKSS